MNQFDRYRGYGTHLPMLVEAFFRTKGTVIEHGAGLFSTQLLSYLCCLADRCLITVEQNADWLDVTDHPGCVVETINSLDASERFGLVLIDGGKDERRSAIDLLRSRTDVFVIHDWESRVGYRYPTDWKYIRVYDVLSPSTAICSDTQDVRQPFRSK